MLRKIIHRNNIKEITIITGQQKSGKTLITKLISTFKGPINIKIEFGLDNIIQLLKNNFINLSQFKDIFLLILDNMFINSILGRSLNLKRNEESSIWNTSNPQFYLKKIKTKIGKKKLKSLIKKEKDFFITLHNFIEFKNTLAQNIPKIKIIYVYTNPVDQINDLYNSKKFITAGEKIDRSILFSYKKRKIFNDVYGYEKKYLKFSRLGKILLLKNIYDISDLKSIYDKIRNIKILKINYNDFLNQPIVNTLKVSKFVNKRITNKTKKYLFSKEMKLRKKNLNKKKNFLKEKILISKIKNDEELSLFKKIKVNYKKFYDNSKNF